MVFPVVMYGCESWTVKKAEHWKIDAFELCCWRRLLRVPWTARRSVLGVHWKDWCWSWNSNPLATSCEELTHWKRPDPGRDWGQEEKGTTEDEMAGWITDSMGMSLSKLQQFVMDREDGQADILLQVIFLTQGSNPPLSCLLHWQMSSLPLVPPGKPTFKQYHDICLSVRLHSVWQSLGPSMLLQKLQMALFSSFCGWLIFYCVCVYICIYTKYYLSINLCMDIQFVCFHVLAMVNSAAVNTGECMYHFELEVCLDICSVVGLLGHMVTPILDFFKEYPCCSPE